MRKITILAIVLFAGVVAVAADGSHGADHGIPWGMIQKQAFNFLLVVGGLVFLLKGKVKDYYASRVETFEKMAILAKKAKQDAEEQKREINSRLAKLEATAAESIEQAKREAIEMGTKIENEARALSEQLKKEAQESARREIERAKQELKDEVLNLSMAQARENMKTSVKDQDQMRLQNEFVSKIQVVR